MEILKFDMGQQKRLEANAFEGGFYLVRFYLPAGDYFLYLLKPSHLAAQAFETDVPDMSDLRSVAIVALMNGTHWSADNQLLSNQ